MLLSSAYDSLSTVNPNLNTIIWNTNFQMFLCIAELDWNKLVQVWNIARHFYLSSFMRVVKSTLERMVLGICHKKRIS